MRPSIFHKSLLLLRETKDYIRLFDETNRAVRTLVIYSERDIYYQYYEGYINYIIEHSDFDICYITSDDSDPIFRIHHDRIHPFYINNLLPNTIAKLDAKVLVMTMPDLDLYHIKRSANSANHVYLFHGVGSIHLQYNKKAFDAYDTIFCIGPYDFRELQKAEAVYNLRSRMLVKCGYYRIEKIYRQYQNLLKENHGQSAESKTIMIAPSWHPDNILDLCINDLITILKDSPYMVIIRPHPEYLKRRGSRIQKISKELESVENIVLELDMAKGTSILNADVLITDWSAISFEYAFGTERPVLFINTPCKIHNPDYQELNLEPIEFTLRDQIGLSINIEDIPRVKNILEDFIQNKAMFQDRIMQCREQNLYNWLHSDEIGGKYLINECRSGEV